MFWIYILKSNKDSGYYIGQTKDIEKRIEMHNKGLIRSTKSRIPFTLLKTESFITRGETRVRENYLKSLKGGNEFRKVIGIK